MYYDQLVINPALHTFAYRTINILLTGLFYGSRGSYCRSMSTIHTKKDLIHDMTLQI